jgi:DNA-binding transcriptional LysR family regulator
MELRQLNYFLAAAQTQNFIQAAELCSVAQSNLSRQIAALEAELKTELFKRANKRVSLTPAGQEFANYVKEALGRLQAGQQFVNKLQTGETGLVRVGCVQPLASTFLPGILKRFGEMYPAIKLRVQIGRTDDLMRLVEQNELDFGLIFDPTVRPELLVVKELFRQSLQLVAPEGHRLCELEPSKLTLERVAAEPLIMLNEPSRLRRTVNRIFAQRGLSLEPKIEVNSSEILRELVRQGAGVAIMPPISMKTKQAEDDLRLLPISDLAEEFIFALVYRSFGATSVAARELIKRMVGDLNNEVWIAAYPG